jgi:hypothetical protein
MNVESGVVWEEAVTEAVAVYFKPLSPSLDRKE